MNFQWKPFEGPDHDALERMKQYFQRPDQDPHEAWFNTLEQRYHSGLLEALTTNLDLAYVERCLFDMGSGLKNFGRRDDWVEWFLFLLPYLVEHTDHYDFLCYVINYFFNLYPVTITEEYPGFRDDVLGTLGEAVMASDQWSVEKRDGWHFSEPLRAALIFCLKYLYPAEINDWASSVKAIPDADWQEDLTKWLRGFKHFLELLQHPEYVPEPIDEFERGYKDTFDYRMQLAGIEWRGSHIVFGLPYSFLLDYLPVANIEAFWSKFPDVRK